MGWAGVGGVVVAVEQNPVNACVHVIVTPNRSLTWRGVLLFYGLMCAVSLSVAVGVTLLWGAWPVLPFAGLELLGLGAVLYHTARGAGFREVVSIDQDTLVIERGQLRPETRVEFPRVWVRVVYNRSRNNWYPGRVSIGSHGRCEEVGAHVCEEERARLALELHRAMARYDRLGGA